MDQRQVALTTKRMIDARAVLVRDNPFFGRLSLGLQLACASCETACTDGERLIFDPDFAARMKTEKEMQFVILHEVLHCALEHYTRVGSRDSELYNIACDIVVNSIILGMWGLDTFQVAGSEPMHIAPDGLEGREYNAEQVYQMLLSDAEEKGSGADSDSLPDKNKGQTIDRHDVWRAITNEARTRDIWKKRIQKAAADCKGVHLPPSIRKIAEGLQRRSRIDWKQLLHDFLQYDEFDYNFSPPDRRFSDGDYFLPAFQADEDLGSARDIWVCVDTSGSVTDQELKEVMDEVQDAMRQAGLTGFVSFFDEFITEPVPFTTEEEFGAIPPVGGGWTSFQPIFRKLKEWFHPDMPRAILIFTDGYVCDFPKEESAMEVPVIWLISKGGNTDVPWGKVIAL